MKTALNVIYVYRGAALKMAEDGEILRHVWDGKVRVSFTLAANEGCSMEQPEQMFLLVPRLTYFPLLVDRLQRHFHRLSVKCVVHFSILYIF